MSRWVTLAILAAVLAACGGPATDDGRAPVAVPPTPRLTFPPGPPAPDGPPAAGVREALDRILADLPVGRLDTTDVDVLGGSGDPRVAWQLADLLRVLPDPGVVEATLMALEELTGVRFAAVVPWVAVVDHLIAWDLPATPGYTDDKRAILTILDPRWAPFLVEPNAIDERLISWGGVLADGRPEGSVDGCAGCIPALDMPGVVGIEQGSWYPDDGVVFGVEVGGEHRAYPRNVMETHELVNDVLAGRRLALVYCTLCGAAQLFFTDTVSGFAPPVLRTSGLLNRSNKVMFDLRTDSAFDTFTGRAVSGPLWEAGVVLDQGAVVTTTWAAWRQAHPGTTIVAEDGGVGRSYDPDPLRGRDDQGPIFPIGDRDLRLPVHEQVVGVVAPDGTPVAFPVAAAGAALAGGETVEAGGVRLVADGGGLRAVGPTGESVASHQAFWFAWSQFHPDTVLWLP